MHSLLKLITIKFPLGIWVMPWQQTTKNLQQINETRVICRYFIPHRSIAEFHLDTQGLNYENFPFLWYCPVCLQPGKEEVRISSGDIQRLHEHFLLTTPGLTSATKSWLALSVPEKEACQFLLSAFFFKVLFVCLVITAGRDPAGPITVIFNHNYHKYPLTLECFLNTVSLLTLNK